MSETLQRYIYKMHNDKINDAPRVLCCKYMHLIGLFGLSNEDNALSVSTTTLIWRIYQNYIIQRLWSREIKKNVYR